MQELNSSNFESTLQENELSLVVFSAPWCGPCKALKPKIPDLVSSTGKNIAAFTVDLESNMDLASEYKISAVPFIATFKNGTLVQSLTTSNHQKILEMLNSL